MAYARLGSDGSNVYVFHDVGGYYRCCFCALASADFQSPLAADMAAHLREHLAAGHVVPDGVIEAILADGDIQKGTT